MSEVILRFIDVSKAFFGVPVLKRINLDVQKGNVLGLIGENGAGKSTLMNILGGVVPLDSGKMLLNGNAYHPHDPAQATAKGIAFIHQELNLFTNLTIAENFFINNFPHVKKLPILNWRAMQENSREFLRMVDLPISPDIPVEKLSPGERQLVEVAKALSQKADIFIFDEPTTSLTARETERLFSIIDRMRETGKTIIYISHILRDVLRLADEIAILRDGELVAIGEKPDFTIQKMISLMVGREIEHLYPERSGKTDKEVILEVQGLCKAGLVHDINFQLHKGEILGIFGLMGSGRSELAQIIFGMEGFDKGRISVRGKAVKGMNPNKSIRDSIAFLTENRREEGLMMSATVSENIGLVALPNFAVTQLKVVQKKKLVAAITQMVELLQVKVHDAFRNQAKGLSGGNQQKVVIGKWLMTQPNILIVDEPTRGVDVGAKFEIYTILDDIAAKGAAVLFISSEIEELIGICDRILVMGYGEILGAFQRSEFDKEAILRTAFRENGNEK